MNSKPVKHANVTAPPLSEGVLVTVISALLALPADGNTLRGVIASRGLAVGYALQLSRPELSVAEPGAGVAHENIELDRARAAVKARLGQAAESGPGAARGSACSA